MVDNLPGSLARTRAAGGEVLKGCRVVPGGSVLRNAFPHTDFNPVLLKNGRE